MRIKINIITFITVLAVPVIFLLACTPEDLGLPTLNGIETKTEEFDAENGSQLSEEELFLEMKARQDKNPLSDINVRKAIMHAVDRTRIIDEIFDGYNNVSQSLFVKESPYWNPSWSDYDFDLDKAGEFLAKAGYGPDNPLYITISAVDNSSSKKVIENILKEDFGKIGINLWIYNETPKEFYQDYVYSGTFELGLWSLYISGGDELQCSFSSGKIPSMETEENKNCENFYWYANTSVDDLLKQLESIDDIEIKKEKTEEVQDILARDAVILPLYSRLFVFAYDSSLRKVDLEILEDRVFYKIENWLLPSDMEITEGEKSEIIIGYESDSIDIFNGFKTYFINDLLFKGLWKNNNGLYTPELVESFSGFEGEMVEIITNDITVTLRDDVYWEDGDPITSEDIKYTFEYFRSFMEQKEYFSNLDEDYLKVKDIGIINEKSFTILFDEYFDEWQKLFTMVFKKGHFDQGIYDNLLYSSITSNGPYKIVEYNTSSGQMVLEINEYYHNALPEIERLVIRFDPDVRNLIAMLKEGEINFLSVPVDPELMHMLEQENGLKVLVKEGNLMEHLALSLKPKEE